MAFRGLRAIAEMVIADLRVTIPEGVQLVLQAGALGKGGELFVLDMGEQVRIMDVAKDLIRLSGLEEGIDVSIEFTGVRPGEKLYEELLFGGEDVRATHHPKVLRATSDPVEASLAERVDHLIRLAALGAGDAVALKDCIREIVPEFSVEDARTNRRLRPSPSLIDAVKQVRELS